MNSQRSWDFMMMMMMFIIINTIGTDTLVTLYNKVH